MSILALKAQNFKSQNDIPWNDFEGVVTTLCHGYGGWGNFELKRPRWLCANLPSTNLPSTKVSLPHERHLLSTINEAFKTLKEFPMPIALIVRDFALPHLAYMIDACGLRSLDIESGAIEMLFRYPELHTPCVDPSGRSVFMTTNSQILRFNPQTLNVAVSSAVTVVTDYETTPTIEPTTLETPNISILSGNSQGFRNGSMRSTLFNYPRLVHCSNDGRELVVLDAENSRLRLVDIGNGIVTTIAGNGKFTDVDGPALTNSMVDPHSAIPDPLHPKNSTEPADLIITTNCSVTTNRSLLRRLNRRTGQLSSLPLLTSAIYNIVGTPSGWCVATSTNDIYACDPQTGRLIQLAGCSFRAGFSDGPAFAARFSDTYQPLYVPPTMAGQSPSVLIPDGSNNAIRRLTLAPFFGIPPPQPVMLTPL